MLPHAYFQKVLKYFRGDNEKAWAWFHTWNPSLGAIPFNMIKKGREKKLIAFIDSQLDGWHS